MKINSPFVGLAALIGACAALSLAAFYFFLPAPSAAPEPPPAVGSHAGTDDMESRVAALASRLQEHPEDGEGWAMLARSQAAMNRFAEAASAFRRAVELRPGDANLLADYADVLAVRGNGDLRGEPAELIRRALAIEPQHVKALALAGTEAFNRSDFATAIKLWKNALAVAPADSGFLPSLRGGIADAEAQLGRSPAPAASGAVVAGRVSLAPALRGKVGPDDTVFVLVRAADGGKMPLAALRTRVRDLPADFAFTDEATMLPGQRLSDQPRLVVLARLSRSGDAVPQAGDYESEGQAVAPGTRNARLLISRPRP